jgi:hypothetical protein
MLEFPTLFSIIYPTICISYYLSVFLSFLLSICISYYLSRGLLTNKIEGGGIGWFPPPRQMGKRPEWDLLVARSKEAAAIQLNSAQLSSHNRPTTCPGISYIYM